MWSLRNDVTIYSRGWGGYGSRELGTLSTGALGLGRPGPRFGEGQIDIDNLAAGASGDLGTYSVDIERKEHCLRRDGTRRGLRTALRVARESLPT